MLATFMEVLDTSVANVALPHIAGNLSATTYMMAERIADDIRGGHIA